jgi:hypothetical protein
MKERLTLQMEHPGDRLDVSEDLELFSLAKIKSASALRAVRGCGSHTVHALPLRSQCTLHTA